MQLKRSIKMPVRTGLTWEQLWKGDDHGLIACWESGREFLAMEPFVADRAIAGELVSLPWKGGTESVEENEDGKEKQNGKNTNKNKSKYGTLRYLAMWQGIRGEDLDIIFTENTVTHTCQRTKREIAFCGSPVGTFTYQEGTKGEKINIVGGYKASKKDKLTIRSDGTISFLFAGDGSTLVGHGKHHGLTISISFDDKSWHVGGTHDGMSLTLDRGSYWLRK